MKFKDYKGNVLLNTSYSSTEEKTGEKWVNGKPLYRCYSAWYLGAVNTWAYLTIGSNVDWTTAVVTKSNAKDIKTGVCRTMPYIEDTSLQYAVFTQFYNNKVGIRCGNKYVSGCSGWIVVEYTKTTD